jgi:hypothetical protein
VATAGTTATLSRLTCRSGTRKQEEEVVHSRICCCVHDDLKHIHLANPQDVRLRLGVRRGMPRDYDGGFCVSRVSRRSWITAAGAMAYRS